MAKLYRTDDVKKIFYEKIKEHAAGLVGDQWLDDSEIAGEIRDLRKVNEFVGEVIADMVEADRKDDEEMAAWRAKKAAEEGEGL